MVTLQVGFLVVPDQRHMRYLIPALPMLAIGEAWWLTRWWLQGRRRRIGWVIAALALATNVLQSPRWSAPLSEFTGELTTRYVGPMEGVVDYLRAHGRPEQVVKIPYDNHTLMFYTPLRVQKPSEFFQETYPDWLVIRRGWIPAEFLDSPYFKRIEATYERIELDAPDALWQNREDPGSHHFRRPSGLPPVVIYRQLASRHGIATSAQDSTATPDDNAAAATPWESRQGAL